VLENKTYTDRNAAGNSLVYLVNDHKEDHHRGREGPIVLGEIAGFRLEYRSTLPDKITLRGHAAYLANVSPSPVGSISSLEHTVRRIDEHVIRARAELDRCQKDVVQLAALNGAVFEHEERYRDLIARQAELVALLDITKNQASAGQAAEEKEGIDQGVEGMGVSPEAALAAEHVSTPTSHVSEKSSRQAAQLNGTSRARLSA
jgi:hypothetical protein